MTKCSLFFPYICNRLIFASPYLLLFDAQGKQTLFTYCCRRSISSVCMAFSAFFFLAAAGPLIVGFNSGPFITSPYCLVLFLRTIYSVPPFRMKRFPVAAFLIIATLITSAGKGVSYQLWCIIMPQELPWDSHLSGVPLRHVTHTRRHIGPKCSDLYSQVNQFVDLGSNHKFICGAPVAFITTSVTLFALVIAVTKDLPDVGGDRKFQISTFATKLGVRNIAFLGRGLLLLNYIGSVLAAVYMPQAFRRSVMIPAHTLLAMCLIFQVLVMTGYVLMITIININLCMNIAILRRDFLFSC
ncbi:hypothetical protein RJ641_027355 [Dillenia turbinata]|uniref:Uncharacterized protein n=1 Tax=Dillenia turbinata TaxID=194707 RepID=A0AAN8VW24_9MAGN